MAGNYTIPVDVELRTKQQNVKNLRSAIENEFRDIDFNSSIGKQLNKLFNQFDTKISDMDSILGKGILDMGDLNKLNGIFNRMNLIVGQMRSSAHKAPLVDLGIDAQSVPELVEARNLVKQITSEIAKQKAVSTKDRLKQTGQQVLLDDLNKIQKTRAHENKPLGVNAKIIQEELAEAEHLIKQHYEKRDQLDKQFQEKSAKAKQSQKILDDAEADYVKNAQKASLKQIMALETAAGKKGKKSTLESQFGGGNKLSQKSAQKFLDEFMVEAGMAFEGTQISGTLTQKLWEGMFTENEIAQMQQAGGDIGEALYVGLEQKLLDPTSRERFRQIVHDFSKNATGSAEGYANTADNIKKNLPNLMNQAKADAVEVQAIEQSQIDNANAIATLKPQIASFKAVVDRLATAASTLETVIQNKYQKELNEANKAAEQAKTNAVDQSKPILAGAQVGNEPIPQYQQQGIQAQEAEKFKTDLQQSIKQWMGVREVINYVKQGIRQAWTDIQGLDKAMTNIAVVTDFSVSDLWGKINEYMSIAQQYGVTTQGVYEVSQLYFQQGLGEADTMAATTETLKMARIAGMDYAEAADGMTVAIRGFNMEMQDAAHVTDVYSKVAAITASDTQELVTAMSKTASSAAAVGSSFENTTAMLAVMIEATRESPQNLGSALKSIISRYGEMTKGLSEDSEGEEIDYNRVDTALKTVGISLKDAQGQFRDFDMVIEELSAKWATLDSVTQRYIATIFAGNRQQSRFLALVSNYDRYMEVSEAAANSEDAGLLQYSKTLDSLETKLNNIKTSFQQFYMSLINGDNVKGALDFINNLIKGLNKLNKLSSIFNLTGIVASVKLVGNSLVNSLTPYITQISNKFKQGYAEIANSSRAGGMTAGKAFRDAYENAIATGSTKTQAMRAGGWAGIKAFGKNHASSIANIAALAGSGLSLLGISTASNNAVLGSGLSMAGSALSGATIGASFGLPGAVIGGIVGAVSQLPSLIKSLDKNVQAQEQLTKLRETTEEKNIERAQAKSDYENLSSLLKQYKDLEETRYDNDETYEKWLDVNNQLTEAYPALLGYIDEHGNAIADITNASTLLSNAMQNAANATADYYYAKVAEIEQELRISRETVYAPHYTRGYGKREAGYEEFSQAKQSALQYSTINARSHLQQMTSEQIMNWVKGEGIDLQKALADIQGHGKGYSGIADYLWFIGAIEESAEGVFSWAEDFNKYIKATEQLQTLDVTKKSGALAGISNASKLSTFDDAIEGISGYTALIETYATSFKDMSWEDLVKISEEDYDKLIREFVLFYDGLSTSQQEILSDLYDNLQNLSLSDLQTQFKDFGLEDTKLYQTYYKEWINQNYQTRYKLAESIFSKDAFIIKKDLYSSEELLALASGEQVRSLKDEKFGTYAEWLEQGGYEDNATNREIYYQRSIAFIKDINEGLGNFIENSTLSQLQSYADFINKEVYIQEGGGEAGKVSVDRQKTITDLISRVYDEEDSFFSQLKPETLVEFFDLLFAEPGTNEWAKNLEQFVAKYGDLGVNFSQLVFENFSTQTNMVLDEIDSFTEEIDDLATKQEKGFTLPESFNLLKDLQKKDSSTTWDDIFKYNEEGILVLRDFNSILSSLYEDQFNIKDLRSKYQTGLDFIENLTQDKKTLVSGVLGLQPEADLDNYTTALSEFSDLSPEVIDSMATYLSQNIDATVESFTEWYYQTFGVPLENAQKYLDNYNKIKLQEETIRTRTEELEGSLEERNKQATYQLLSSKGLEGYTEKEIAQLEEYLGVGKGGLGAIETGEGTGEYRIDQTKLTDLPTWVQNAILSIVNDSVQSAKDGLEALAESVATKEKLSSTQKRDILGSEFSNLSDQSVESIWSDYESAMITGNFDHLEKILIAVFDGKEGVDTETAKRMAAESIARFQDNIDEDAQAIIDLKFAALEDAISNEDLNKLVQRGIDVSGLINKTQEGIHSLIQEIINNIDISFEDKASQATKAYKYDFDREFGVETDVAKTLAETDSWDRSATESFLGELSVLTKIDYNIRDWFQQRTDGTFELVKTEAQLATELNNITNDNIRQQVQDSYKFLKDWSKQTKKESALSELEGLATQSEFTASEIRDFYFTQLNENLTAAQSEDIAKYFKDLDPMARLNEWVRMYQNAGISIDQDKYQQLVSLVLDSIIESISSGLSQLSSGIDGTLSFSDFTALQQKYGLTGRGTTQSSKGVTLGKDDQQRLISELYKVAEQQGLQGEFGDQLWQSWMDAEDSAIEGYIDIEDAIKNCYDEQGNLVGATEEYVKALQQARHSAMFDENAVEFAFMEQDAIDGLTKNFDKFSDGIDKVKDAFTAFEAGEAIGYQDFYNIMDYIGNSEAGFAKFSEITGVAAGDYEAFVNAVVANTDKWGQVDIGRVAAEMGISVETAMQGMSEGMTESLKEVAKQQVKYLTSVEQMLEAMLILEGIGSIDLSMTFSFQGQERELKDVYDIWKDLSPEEKKELEVVLKTALEGQGKGGQMIIDAIWGDGDGMDFLEAGMLSFFGGKADWLATPEGQTFMTSLGGLTEGLALDMASILSDEDYSQYFNEQGTGFADGMMDAFFAQYFSDLTGVDFNSLRENASIQLSQLLAQSGGTMELDMGENSITLTGMDGNKLQFADGTNITEDMMGQLTQSLQTAMGREGMKLSLADGAVTVTNWGTTLSNASEGAQQINEDFATAAEAATELNTAITNITSAASSFQGSSGFQTLADQLNAAAGAAERLNEALGGAEGPDTSFIESQLAGAEQALALLQMGGAEPEIIAGAEAEVAALQMQLNSLAVPEGATAGLVGELTNAIDIANRLSDALANNNGTPLEVNFNVDEANDNVTVLIANLLQLNAVFKPTIEIEDKASSVLEGIIQLIANIHSKTVTIATIHKDIYTSASSSGNGGISDKGGKDNGGPGPFAGTMNGLAFADGSLGRLHSGAVLANKALVGELGPELAVYDGQYHMLGANGAEFVDLPSDAIIFNHLQTQGILRGQMNIRGTAMADGNVSGPAYASGIGAALSAVRRAKSVWQGLLNSLSAADLVGGGGGGGGGGDESLKAHIADLQEWYNLSRQIVDIEGQINVLLAKRKNITDGHEYLRNLRETQRLLDDQVNTQQDLLRFQELQLQRQAEHINNNKIWSQFLEVDENGLLQYKKGNETNGGKGALEVLSQMNEMSGEEQLAFVQSLGWSYTNTDGEELENEELVAKFYEELQKQIDDYDALRDTVQETEGTLADLEEQINEIEREIRDNEIDLSKEIYDIIVDAWKENIENLKEQNDLIKEANEAYANGIQKALDTERQQYEQNQAIADREQLQRQLSLLRRSGGSASEIADLEQQLDDMLQDEYFTNQENTIETIRDANQRQAELLDQQVKLQEDALEYEKENGVIWSKVYEIMQGTDAEILNFMQGKNTEFFTKSYLQQEDMLTEWSKKIGIYTEERQRQNYASEAVKTFSNVWNNETSGGLQDAYNRAGSAQQEEWKREYNDTYASKMLEGKSHEEALKFAQEEFYEHLRNWVKAEEDKKKQQQQQTETFSSEESDTSERDPNQRWKATGRYGNSQGDRTDVAYGRTREEALENLPHSKSFYNISYGAYQRYAKGGIIDYTGPAWVDGSKSKPERILSAEQNKILEEGLAMVAGRGETLKEAFNSFASNLGSSVRAAVSNITKNTDNSNFTIAPGAVQLQISQLNDKYDVDELFNDVADRLYSIAAKASGRGVSRR